MTFTEISAGIRYDDREHEVEICRIFYTILKNCIQFERGLPQTATVLGKK